MFLVNSLKKISFFVCVVAVFYCAVPIALAMDNKIIEEEKNDKKGFTTPQKNKTNLREYSQNINLEDPLTTTKEESNEELNLSQEISSSMDSKDLKTPPQKTNPFLKSFTDPTHDKLSQKKVPISLKPSIQWIGHRDFTLVDESTKYTYKPSDSHFVLRKMVDDNVKHFPGSENLFALQLTFLVSSENFGIESFRTIACPLRVKLQEKVKNLLFVSGSTSIKNDDTSYIFSSSDIHQNAKNQWFKEIYGKTYEELNQKKSAQTHFHSEQWAMIYIFNQIGERIEKLCKRNQISKIHGLFLDGHTWNDHCEICQQMIHVKSPQLENKIKVFFDKNPILSQNFFVLPILSSQDWYNKSKRLKPLEIQNLELLQCDKRETKGTINDEEKTKSSETCNRFFQSTNEYKVKLENQSFLNSFNIQNTFINKHSFPCFWLYKEEEVLKTLKDKVFDTFTKVESFQGKIGKKSDIYLIFNHPTLKIWKGLPFYPFQNVTPELVQFKKLTSLSIISQHLGNGGAQELAQALTHLTTLTMLNLPENGFGVPVKLNILSLNSSINSIDTKRIDVEKKELVTLEKGSEMSYRSGFDSLLISLSFLKNLTYLNLSKNILNGGTSQALSQTLAHLTNLRTLGLQSTTLDYNLADNILTAAHNVPSITDINFSQNKIFHHCNNNVLVQQAAALLFQKTLRIHVNNGKFAKQILLNLDDNTLEGVQF